MCNHCGYVAIMDMYNELTIYIDFACLPQIELVLSVVNDLIS